MLSEWPEERTALASLVTLYTQTEQYADPRRTLTTLLRQVQEPSERSRYLFALGELLDKLGEADDAYRLNGEAFFLDPANRAAFTAYERALLSTAAVDRNAEIYDVALRLIETQKTRSLPTC